MLFSKKSSFQLHAYSDANSAGCSDDHRSTGGFCIFLGSHPISWSSKKQHTIIRSNTEPEYKFLANTSVEIIWLQTLIKELGFHLTTPPVLWYDNLGANYLTSNPMYHSHTKHMDIDFHFVRDRVAAKTLQVQLCSSGDHLADVFTKPLVLARFFSLRSSLVWLTPLLTRKGVLTLPHNQQRKVSSRSQVSS